IARAPRGLDILCHCLGSIALLLQRLSQVPYGALRRLSDLPRFFARLARLRRLHLVFALRRGEFARQRGTARAFFVERLTMLRRTCGQLLSHSSGLLREGGRFLPLLLERLCSVRGCCLPELLRFFARLAQLRCLLLNFV